MWCKFIFRGGRDGEEGKQEEKDSKEEMVFKSCIVVYLFQSSQHSTNKEGEKRGVKQKHEVKNKECKNMHCMCLCCQEEDYQFKSGEKGMHYY